MIDTEELSFEQRLGKVYVKQKHSQSKDLYLLVQSQSDLIELVGDFTKFVDVMIEGFNPKMVSEEKFEIVVKFINSLKDVPIEKHIVLRNKIVDKISLPDHNSISVSLILIVLVGLGSVPLYVDRLQIIFINCDLLRYVVESIYSLSPDSDLLIS